MEEIIQKAAWVVVGVVIVGVVYVFLNTNVPTLLSTYWAQLQH